MRINTQVINKIVNTRYYLKNRSPALENFRPLRARGARKAIFYQTTLFAEINSKFKFQLDPSLKNSKFANERTYIPEKM